MQPLHIRDMSQFASRSVAALMEIVVILEADEDRRPGTDVYFEAARSIKYVFDNIAWSDGSLDQKECALLDAILIGHPRLNEQYLKVVEVDPLAAGLIKIPFLLDIAHDYDQRNATYLSFMTINALEMIGYGVVTANGQTSEDELNTFRDHIAAMREYIKNHA